MDLETAVVKLRERLLAVDKSGALNLVSEIHDAEEDSLIIDQLIMPALEDIGERWERGEVSLSQVYMSGKICEEIVDRYISEGASFNRDGERVAVAVLMDHHNLGKRILATVLKTRGYHVIDYGHAITVDKLVENVERDSVGYLMISTLMLPAALHINEAIQRIRERSPDTKVLVGGAPFIFDDELWKDVGADAYGRTATESVGVLKRMIEEVD